MLGVFLILPASFHGVVLEEHVSLQIDDDVQVIYVGYIQEDRLRRLSCIECLFVLVL